MATFKGYQIKGMDIDKLIESSVILDDKPNYAIHLLLEPIEGVIDDSVEINPKPSEIWSASFDSIGPPKLRAFTSYGRDHQHIHISLDSNKGKRLLDGDEFYIYVQGFDIGSIAEHSQFFVDLVDAVNKQALSKIEEKVQEKQEQEKAKENFRKKAEKINEECFPGTPTSE